MSDVANRMDDNTLDYMDQGSFLGLRARNRDPLIHWCWVYDHEVDVDALRRFQRHLGRGLLGRRIERSPLPFGRHRWVAWTGPDDLVIANARPREEMWAWADEQAGQYIDPEHGPPWRFAVLPLTDGGAMVNLVISHSIADGVGAVVAITEAANGHDRELGYPPPRSRPVGRAFAADLAATVRNLPEVAKSLVSAARLARKNRSEISRQRPPAVLDDAASRREVISPSILIHVDATQWDQRAAALSGSAPTMVLGFAARYAHHLGWTAPDGRVNLAIPISERQADDTRANALTNVTFAVDPDEVGTDLSGVRAQFKSAMQGLAESGNELFGPLPLVPFVPRRVISRLEGVVLRDKEVGCSYLGELDPAANRPDGTDAEASFLLPFEKNITLGHLRRHGGIFFPVIAGRLHGKVWISLSYSNSEGSTTREDLRRIADLALADMGLSGIVQ